MGDKRRKIRTTINLDPELRDFAKKRNINISKEAEDSIRKLLSPREEKRLIYKEMAELQERIDILQDRLNDLDKLEGSASQLSTKKVLEILERIYVKSNYSIEDGIILEWSNDLDISFNELKILFDDEIVQKYERA